jgi:hypothetical protein
MTAPNKPEQSQAPLSERHPRIRAFRVEAGGVAGITFAASAGRARTNGFRAAKDAGYGFRYPDFRVRRAPEFDGRPKIAEISASRGTVWVPERLAYELGVALVEVPNV